TGGTGTRRLYVQRKNDAEPRRRSGALLRLGGRSGRDWPRSRPELRACGKDQVSVRTPKQDRRAATRRSSVPSARERASREVPRAGSETRSKGGATASSEREAPTGVRNKL